MYFPTLHCTVFVLGTSKPELSSMIPLNSTSPLQVQLQLQLQFDTQEEYINKSRSMLSARGLLRRDSVRGSTREDVCFHDSLVQNSGCKDGRSHDLSYCENNDTPELVETDMVHHGNGSLNDCDYSDIYTPEIVKARTAEREEGQQHFHSTSLDPVSPTAKLDRELVQMATVTRVSVVQARVIPMNSPLTLLPQVNQNSTALATESTGVFLAYGLGSLYFSLYLAICISIYLSSCIYATLFLNLYFQ